MHEPRAAISVILPTFNRADRLLRAVESVQSQTCRDWELIVVNDGSTDTTSEVLAGVRDARVRMIFQENRGLPEALNAGHERASGEFVTWISDDCWVEPQWLVELHAGLSCLDSRYGMVFTDYYLHEYGSETATVAHTQCASLPERNRIGASFLYRRSDHEKAGRYDAEALGAEDWDHWLRMAACCRMRHLSTPPRFHYLYGLPTSMSVALRERVERSSDLVRRRHAAVLPLCDAEPAT